MILAFLVAYLQSRNDYGSKLLGTQQKTIDKRIDHKKVVLGGFSFSPTVKSVHEIPPTAPDEVLTVSGDSFETLRILAQGSWPFWALLKGRFASFIFVFSSCFFNLLLLFEQIPGINYNGKTYSIVPAMFPPFAVLFGGWMLFDCTEKTSRKDSS